MLPEPSAETGRVRRHAGTPADDRPDDLDGLIVAGVTEVKDEPARRSAIRLLVIVGAGILILLLLLFAGAQWILDLGIESESCVREDIFVCLDYTE